MGDIRIGEILLSKEDLQNKVTTKRGVFVTKLPNNLEKQLITRNTAAAIGYASLESMLAEEYLLVRMVQTLKIVLVDTPDWFNTVEDCLDQDLLLELFTEHEDFVEKFRGKLRQNKFRRVGKES